MLILRRQFHNLLGQPIVLDIHRFTNCLQIMVTRSPRRTDPWQWICLVVLTVLIISVMVCTQSYKTVAVEEMLCPNNLIDPLRPQLAGLIISLSLLLAVLGGILWSPVYRETIVLLDNLSGLELTREYQFWKTSWRRSQFILTNDIIINEAITMHRVIYYLVAIPLSLSPLLSSDDNLSHSKQCLAAKTDPNKSKSATIMRNGDTSRLIPLFCKTCPRIDCLKLIYRQIYCSNIKGQELGPNCYSQKRSISTMKK